MSYLQPSEDIFRWGPTLVTGAIALIGWAVTWGGMRRDVHAHEQRLNAHSAKLDDHESRISYIEGSAGGA